MPDIPTDPSGTTNIGWQHGGTDIHDDNDHLVIDSSYGQAAEPQQPPLISFTNTPAIPEPEQAESSQPSFLNVDAQGLESPLELFGADEQQVEDDVPPVIWFGEESDLTNEISASDQQVFS